MPGIPCRTARASLLTLAGSSRKEALVGGIALDYGRTHPVVGGRCVTVRVSNPSGAVADALTRGRDEPVDGPRPDVWAPASDSWLVILRQRVTGIILLTDGRNEYPPDTNLDGLLWDIESLGGDRPVHIFPVAFGTDADLEVRARIASSSGASLYNAADPRSIQRVFSAVVSNF